MANIDVRLMIHRHEVPIKGAKKEEKERQKQENLMWHNVRKTLFNTMVSKLSLKVISPEFLNVEPPHEKVRPVISIDERDLEILRSSIKLWKDSGLVKDVKLEILGKT